MDTTKQLTQYMEHVQEFFLLNPSWTKSSSHQRMKRGGNY